MNRAASHIQNHFKMTYLKLYLKDRIRAGKIMVKVWPKYHFKYKAIKQKLDEYFHENKNSMEELRALETSVIFKEFDGLNDLEDLENYTRVKFFEGKKSFRECIPHIESFIPSKSSLRHYFNLFLELPPIDLNPKMRMFALLVDFDC